jgi:hypothetical protein
VSTPFRSNDSKQPLKDGNHSKRTWNTPIREPWNPVIKHCLNAIDYHIDLYVKTGHTWHLDQAEILRVYLLELKNWIIQQEKLHHTMEDAD